MRTATFDHLVELAARAFPRENAVLLLDGPIPEGLRLHLGGDGERWPVRLPQPVFPNAAATAGETLSLSGLVDSGSASSCTLQVLADRVRRVVGPDPDSSWAHELVALGGRALLVLARVPGEGSAEQLRVARDELERLAEQGPTQRELEEFRTLMRTRLADSSLERSEPWLVADAFLRGGAPIGADEILAETEAVDIHAVRAVAAGWRDSLLVTAPERSFVPDLPWLADRRAAPSGRGRSFRPTFGARLADSPRFVLDGSLLYAISSTTSTSIDLRTAEALATRPDGNRLVVGEDGTLVDIEPNTLVAGDTLVGVVDSLVPSDRRVPLDARLPREIPVRVTLPGWLWSRLFGSTARIRITAIAVGTMLLLVAVPALFWSGRLELGFGIVFAYLLVVGWLVLQRAGERR